MLKNFAIKTENGKYKICVLDLIKYSANYRNTGNAFCEMNLYDLHNREDTKELEKKFNDLIEKPMSKLLQRICSAKETVSFSRTESNTVARYEIAHQSSCFDNYVFQPISSNCALLMVAPECKYVLLLSDLLTELQLFSPILLKYLALPQNDYVNWDKMKEVEKTDIPKYFTQDDKFIYKIQTIDEDETIYLNHLIMNEAFCYIGCRTPNKLIPSIRKYNELRAAGQQNMRHDYNGYI